MQKYINNVQDTNGNAIPSVTVTIRDNPGGGLSTIYSDNGVTGKANPFTNDSDGEFFFYAADGRYDVELTGPITETTDDIRLLDISNAGRINTDTDAPAGPTGQVGTGTLDFYDSDDSDRLAQLGFIGGSNGDLRLRNDVHSGHVQLTASQAAGTEVFCLVGDPDAGVDIYHAGLRVLDTHNRGAHIYSSSASAPWSGWHDDSDVLQGYVQFGPSNCVFTSSINGAPVVLQGNDAGTTLQSVFSGDPDGQALIYFAGSIALETHSTGATVRAPTTNDPLLYFEQDDGSTRNATIGATSTTGLYIRNNVHGGHIFLYAENTASGTLKTILEGDPDAITTLRGDTTVSIEAGSGAVSLDYSDQENFRTSDEAGADIGMGAEVRHNDDSFYPVGMNVVPEESAIDTGNETLALNLVGKMIHYNSATARSLLFNNDSNIKVGSMWALKVGPSAGTLTGDGGAGVQIRWWNGTGWTTTAAAGNITIGVGDYQIWKETDTLYHISGPTLS